MQTFLGLNSGVEGKIVVLGAPFDHGSVHHPGAGRAPNYLRALSSCYKLRKGFIGDLSSYSNFLENISITDAGNISYKSTSEKSLYLKQLEEAYLTIIQHDKKILLLGGDHLVTLPCLKAISRKYSNFQVVHLDAHTDYEEVSAEQLPTHANFVYPAINTIPNINKWIQVGLRGISPSISDIPEKIKLTKFENLSELLLPNTPIYLTIDSDVFDPSICPAVSFPVPNGLQFEHFLNILDKIKEANCELIGVDWVEFNPNYDTRNSASGILIVELIARLLPYIQQ